MKLVKNINLLINISILRTSELHKKLKNKFKVIKNFN